MADSRNEDLLENILGGSNEYGEPLSRNEAILQNILGEQNELLPPVSRIETLLLQLKDAMPSGEIEITENGEYDVTGYETATVNVASGGGGGYGGVAVIPIQSIAEAMPTNTTITIS